MLSLFFAVLTFSESPFDFEAKEPSLNQTPADTSRVILLIKLGLYFGSIDQKKALVYLHEAYLFLVELEYKEGNAGSFLFQGRYIITKMNMILP